jgi:hypothetical protein
MSESKDYEVLYERAIRGQRAMRKRISDLEDQLIRKEAELMQVYEQAAMQQKESSAGAAEKSQAVSS